MKCMAREIHEREDLLRDATALTRRVQLRIEDAPVSQDVFAGFRTGQALSLYFGSDPAYHFDSSARLRRAYVDDRLIKAEKGRLVSLTRQTDSSQLLRHDFSEQEQTRFGETLQHRLVELAEALRNNRYRIVGEVSEDGTVVAQLGQWLEGFRQMRFADSPNVK